MMAEQGLTKAPALDEIKVLLARQAGVVHLASIRGLLGEAMILHFVEIGSARN